MFNFEVMLRQALRAVDQRDVTLATPYELPDRVCRDLIEEGAARSIVADHSDVATMDDTCAGWWIDRSAGLLHLRLGKAKNLLIAGVPQGRRLHPALLLEARLKGVARVATADSAGRLIEDVLVASALHEQLEHLDTGPRISDVSYEQAFEAIYSLVGNRLCLPSGAFASERVALCLGSLGPGGAERQGTYTAVGAQENGFDVHVMCSHTDAPADFFRPYVVAQGVPVLKIPDTMAELEDPAIRAVASQLEEQFSALGISSIFSEIVRYAGVLRQVRPGLVHCWMDYCNVLCGTAAHLVGVPGLVLSCRSMAPCHFRIFQPYMRPGYRALLLRRPALLLNNSRAGADDYARWLDIDPAGIRLIHNGFEFPARRNGDTRRRVRAEFGIGEDALVVGSILRFSEEKRPRLLVDMAARILETETQVRFLFFGDGELLGAMGKYVEQLGLTHAIRLPGLTKAVWDVLAAMDLFALASRVEGLPNVLVEAQASGLPIVCTGAGGMRETYIDGTTGLTAAEPSADSLAQCALSILQDPVRRQGMSNSAAAFAREQFGLAHMIGETIKVYEQALGVGEEWQQSRRTA
jgi:glycosyltransferase involved in cell wall biosynthesis